MKYTHCN